MHRGSQRCPATQINARIEIEVNAAERWPIPGATNTERSCNSSLCHERLLECIHQASADSLENVARSFIFRATQAKRQIQYAIGEQWTMAIQALAGVWDADDEVVLCAATLQQHGHCREQQVKQCRAGLTSLRSQLCERLAVDAHARRIGGERTRLRRCEIAKRK